MNAVEEHVQVSEKKRTTIKTTLYDLIAAMQATTEPEEDDVVVGAVVHLLRSGRIRFLGDTSSLN
jgi:hypothetical protein